METKVKRPVARPVPTATPKPAAMKSAPVKPAPAVVGKRVPIIRRGADKKG